MKLLLDEMYPPVLAEALRAAGTEATTAAELRLTGASDADVFAPALASDHVVLTENVADFIRLAAEHIEAGGHHSGILIALSSRFSRRPAGLKKLVTAIEAVAREELADRVVYLSTPATG